MLRTLLLTSLLTPSFAGWFSRSAPVEVPVTADGAQTAASSHTFFRAPHSAPPPPAWVESYDPMAPAASIVVHGPARFTVLAPALVRMEVSPHAPPRFHDEGSFFAVHRAFPTPAFTATVDASTGALRIETSALVLEYSGGAFTADSLRVTLADGRTWAHGDAPAGSLHGTVRTLDRVGASIGLGCTQRAYANDSHCEEGVVSKDGWAVVDDSMGVRWDTRDPHATAASGAWPWVTGPAEMPVTPGATPPPLQCTAGGFNRFECLWGNVVDERGCRARGCCFDPAAAREADGQAPALHMTPWCFWPSPPEVYTDLYFFGFGTDFRGALRAFTTLGGRVPLMPRWALGPMFSRWFAYADHEERGVLSTHARNSIPLDVQILDTDWHMGWTYERGFPPHPPRFPDGPPPTAFPIQWTGWDVNEALLPVVARLHQHLHARGVATGWNFHLPPFVQKSGGVQYTDSVYRPLSAALGLDADAGLPILGDYSNQTWTDIFFSHAVRPLLVGRDVDFAWPDWQQGEWTRMLGLPPTPWLSYLFASAPHFARVPSLAPPRRPGAPAGGGAAAHAARSFVLNRWGGLGAHRYPVGFSGDAETTWEILGLQVYITATAANVAFQWSHDIGGFAGSPDPNLMTRWVQLGVFSPILRPHCAGRGGNTRDIWKFSWPSFEIMRDYFRLRVRLVPYLYTAMRLAYETGVVAVHPLYYDVDPGSTPDVFNELASGQYFFGNDVMVAPVTTPTGDGGLASRDIWFPPGAWIEWFSWQSHSAPQGGATFGRRFTLGEVPLYSRPTTIIPLRTLSSAGDAVGTAVDVPDALTLWVFPPAPNSLGSSGDGTLRSSTRVYDDDGVSVAYAADGASAWTNVSCTWTRGAEADAVECTIARDNNAGSDFPEMPAARAWTLRFISSWPPARVTVGHLNAKLSPVGAPDGWGDGGVWARDGTPSWTYAGDSASVWVNAGAATADALTVRLVWPTGTRADEPLLTSALARKISRAQAAKAAQNLHAWGVVPADVPHMLRVAAAGAVVEDAVAAGAEAGGDAAAMAGAVRAAYTGLSASLRESIDSELPRLAGLGVGGLEEMRSLLENAAS